MEQPIWVALAVNLADRSLLLWKGAACTRQLALEPRHPPLVIQVFDHADSSRLWNVRGPMNALGKLGKSPHRASASRVCMERRGWVGGAENGHR